MTVLQGILLGILQGVAEFLPISSSGHLAVAQKLFSLEELPLLYDVMLHLATLLAVILFFRKKIWELLKVLGRWIARKNPSTKEAENSSDVCKEEDFLCGTEERGRHTIVAIIVTTFVTGIIGVFTSKFISELSIKVTCVGFILTAGLLIFSSLWEKRSKKQNIANQKNEKGISWKQALVIGFMQGVGTLPGISRSGSTIAGSQFCGVNRAAAGEYSFIVSIPAILGAFVLELKDLGQMTSMVGLAQLVAGCLSAFVSGYISLILLMKIIKKGKLEWFACYLIPLGILGLIFF